MLNIKQINQIKNFLSAYPKDIVNAGIEAWKNIDLNIEGIVTDIQLDKTYKELSEDTKQFVKEQSEKMPKILPLCKCGKQLNLTGICGACTKGKEGYKSKFICASCGYEKYFKDSVRDKIKKLEIK